jgi:hypothetical protein
VSLIAMEDKQPHRGLTSFETVMLYSRTRTMKESFGAVPYGGDLNLWPAKLVDAFIILENERQRVDNLTNVPAPQQRQPQPRTPPRGRR